MSVPVQNTLQSKLHKLHANNPTLVVKPATTTNYLKLYTPSIYIPRMHCSFPVRNHPLYTKIQPKIDAWALKMAGAKSAELLAQNSLALCASLGCHLYASARDSAIKDLVKYVYWMTLFDTCLDHTEELGLDYKGSAALAERYFEVIDNPKAHVWDINDSTDKAGRFLASFAGLWRKFEKDMTPGQYHRVSESVKEVLYAATSQNKLRENGIVPSFKEFVEQRRPASGIVPLAKLVEYGVGVDLDDGFRTRSDVEEIARLATDHLCFVNDMISFGPEYLRNDFHNLPCTICASEKVTIQEAVVKTCELIKEKNDRFMELHERISGSEYCNGDLRSFLDGLGYLELGMVLANGTLLWK